MAAGCVAVALLLTGCGGPGPAAPAPAPAGALDGPVTGPNGLVLPARTQTLRLDGVSVCSLVSEEEFPMFGGSDQIPIPGGTPETEFRGGPDCGWTSERPRNTWLGRYIPGSGAVDVLPRAERVLPVEGFWAISVAPETFDPRITCFLTVDTAPGQSLYAQYSNSDRTDAAMTHEKACAEAVKLAGVMIRNARAQGR